MMSEVGSSIIEQKLEESKKNEAELQTKVVQSIEATGNEEVHEEPESSNKTTEEDASNKRELQNEGNIMVDESKMGVELEVVNGGEEQQRENVTQSGKEKQIESVVPGNSEKQETSETGEEDKLAMIANILKGLENNNAYESKKTRCWSLFHEKSKSSHTLLNGMQLNTYEIAIYLSKHEAKYLTTGEMCSIENQPGEFLILCFCYLPISNRSRLEAICCDANFKNIKNAEIGHLTGIFVDSMSLSFFFFFLDKEICFNTLIPIKQNDNV
jgi:hypothetical protein